VCKREITHLEALEMKDKIRKKLVWDDHGVSEIIADILILAMTVVLFAVIFAFVWSLPAPDEAVYADFDSSVRMNEVGGARVNLTHISGEDIQGFYTSMYLIKNKGQAGQDYRQLKVNGPAGEDLDNPLGYGISGDDVWSTSEKWTYYHSSISSSDDLEIMIVDDKTQSLVFGAKLLGTGINDAPIIMERSYSPEPGTNASTITIVAHVRDPDGWDDISASGSVKVNVSAINSTITYLTLNEVSHTEVSGIFSNSILVDRGQGEYTLTIIAEDTSGTIDRRRINVEIGETASNAPQILERWAIPEVGINGSDITIYARVEDRDGYDNLDWVSIDVGSLVNQNGSSYVVNMSDPEGDGIFVYTASIDVLRGDSYRVNFTAVDITDLQSRAHLNITVNRFNPVIARTWSNPTSGKDEEFMTIYAEVSDPDGYSDISEVLVDLSNLDTSLGWVNMTDPELDGIFEVNLTINVTSGGNKTVTFLARDQTGNDVTATMKVFIATLNAPVILERWTDPALLDNNTQTVIFARVIDPDGYDDIDTVSVNISSINQTYNGSAAWFNMVDYERDGNFVNITWSNQEAGSYVIEFRATDKGGNVANATLNVTLLAFRPRFLNVWTNPTIGRNGTDIEIFANVMDPNGYLNIANVTVDIVALNQSMDQGTPYWVDMTDYNMNGTFNYTAPINVNQTGLYSLNFTVMDVDGNTATINHLLLITSHKPTIIQAWNNPDPAINSTNVVILAWVWDDDGYEDIKSVRANVTALNDSGENIWIELMDTDNDGIYQNYTEVNVTFAGEYWVNITVNDTTGNEYIKSLNVTVALTAGSVGEDMVFIGDITPNAVDSLGDLYFTAIAKNGTGENKKIHSVEFKPQWKSSYYSMDRIFEWFFRYPGTIPAFGTTASNIEQIIYFRARNETGSVIAWHNVTLLILYDKSGGKVNEGTALEQNVAWISNDQGFVITNNKTSNDMIQIFDASDQTEYEKIWIKIGSNMITNTEKANIFQLRSQSTGDVVAQFSSPNYEFVYDGVLAGYWFFVLDINTTDIYNWMRSESQIPTLGDGTKSEYFDVYMKIKDTTDDFFSTNSWILVHGGTQGFSAELIAYYDPGYVPGDLPGPNVNGDDFPDDLQRADGETVDPQDDYVFDSIEIVYFRVIMETFNNPPPADFNQFEMIDFKGNRRISSAEGSGPVGSISRNVMFPNEDYMFAVNLLKADKDPWIPGSSAYTCMIKVMSDTNEEYAIVASNVEVSAPTSVMDIVSGRDNVGTGTNIPRYYGDFYENQGGAVWEIEAYAYYDGLTGNKDPFGIIYGAEFEDLDNDDDKDILVVIEGGKNIPDTNPKVVMFDNDGSWTRTDIFSTSGTFLYAVTAGDLDGDGDLDIVTTDDSGTTYLIENEGAAEFSTIPVEVATGSLSINWDHAIAIGDLDGDFDPGQYDDWGDVVLGSDAGLEIISYDGAAWSSTIIDSTEVYSSVDIADYDGDGDLDIVASATAQGDIYLFEHDGTGDMTFTRTLIVDFSGNELAEVAFGDLDGTDDLDIVVARGTEITSYDRFGNPINSDNDFNPSGLTGDIVSLQVGNVDGAIQDDVVIATNDGFVYHYRNLGKATEWLRFEVDDLATRVGGSTKFYSIAIGDANLGGA
jgi:FlaG/FlaF family flagellin (archaellin)